MEDSQPLRGRTMALETRYEVSTQVLSSWPADRLPAMCGRATLAMEVSSTSMNVASVTAKAITQGLTAGRQASAWSNVVLAALTSGFEPSESPTCPDAADDLCWIPDPNRFLPECAAPPAGNVG